MNLTFCRADASDIDPIFTQAKALIDAYEDIDSIDYEKVLSWVRHKITAHISQYRCVLLDGRKCAWYRLCEDGEVDDVYVLLDDRGRGIGSEIMRKCINESPKPVYLYVFSRNSRAIAFYEGFGFTIREKVGNTRLIMERKG